MLCAAELASNYTTGEGAVICGRNTLYIIIADHIQLPHVSLTSKKTTDIFNKYDCFEHVSIGTFGCHSGAATSLTVCLALWNTHAQ